MNCVDSSNIMLKSQRFLRSYCCGCSLVYLHIEYAGLQAPDNTGSDGSWARLVTHCHCQREREREREAVRLRRSPSLSCDASGDIISSIQVRPSCLIMPIMTIGRSFWSNGENTGLKSQNWVIDLTNANECQVYTMDRDTY